MARTVSLALRDPAQFRANMAALWVDIKHELHHYWVGTKLLAKELRIAGGLVRRIGRGEALSRRERMHLKRALADILRMVPFIIIVIIPFAEFALPVLLKVFPNMLPSQFEVREGEGRGEGVTFLSFACHVNHFFLRSYGVCLSFRSV